MLKSRFIQPGCTDRLLSPLAALGLPPLVWSLLSLPLALGGFTALYASNLWLAFVFFAAAGLADMIDGAVARCTDTSTSMGAFLDGIFDRYVEFLLIVGLSFYLGDGFFLGLPFQAWVLLLLFGSLMTSFVRAYADHRRVIVNPDLLNRMGGLLERAERLMILYMGMILGGFDPRWLIVAVALTAVLANLTAIQRVAFALEKGRH